MAAYDETTYGDRLADVYDELPHVKALPTDEAVAFLAELAGPGPVLELAIGTGRIALPLAGRGIEVHGIDASSRMVAKLRAKPGGETIPVTMGNFADVAVTRTYPLISSSSTPSSPSCRRTSRSGACGTFETTSPQGAHLCLKCSSQTSSCSPPGSESTSRR